MEYWIRVVSVWFSLLAVAALILAVLNVPVYILIQNQLQTYSSLYEDASAQNTSFEQIESEIVLANNTAVLLATAQKVDPIVKYLELVDANTNENVTLNSYKLLRTGNVIGDIVISGVAADRESLVDFSSSLEDIEDFVSAEIPLSNLAKDRNIPFTINVVLKKSS